MWYTDCLACYQSRETTHMRPSLPTSRLPFKEWRDCSSEDQEVWSKKTRPFQVRTSEHGASVCNIAFPVSDHLTR